MRSHDRLNDLLAPLYNAGWQLVRSSGPASLIDAGHPVPAGIECLLRRSCLVLGVEHRRDAVRGERLGFVPIAAQLRRPDDGIGVLDAVAEPVVLEAEVDLPGVRRVEVIEAAASAGLLDPTRLPLVVEDAEARVQLLIAVYHRYVGRTAATWRGGPTMHALRALDADEPFARLIKSLMYLAPDVIPDPVPMAAAIGITLDCWRNTEIENLHAGNSTLTDVVMAKLNIITTRALRTHITSHGIDWDAVTGVLLNPERRLYDGRTVLHLIGEPNWPEARASIHTKLDRWAHIEQLAGPEATLRLASVMGSTAYTARWWGNGWWPELSGQVLSHVEYRFPRLLDPEPNDPMPFGFPSEVASHPEYLTDAFLDALIDPPDGQGLRYAQLPDIPRHDLTLAELPSQLID